MRKNTVNGGGLVNPSYKQMPLSTKALTQVLSFSIASSISDIAEDVD